MLYKHIMVAVDGSKTSKSALKEAIRLAKNQKTKLHIIHIVDENFINYGEAPVNYETLRTLYTEVGKKILSSTEKALRQAKVKYECRLVELKPFGGRVAEKIVSLAKIARADLLILGTHGRRGFSHLFLGSVAESVMRIATMPVLLIRGK